MRCIIEYNFQQIPEYLKSYSYANWALDTETRKSTSGGVITFGKHYIKSWSKTQAIVALSSAESELYGLVKCVSETLGVKSALFDFGILVGGVIKSDASAALGIIQRQGLGKLRHIDTSFLYIQQINVDRVLRFEKTSGDSNPSDICTKGLAGPKIMKFIERMSMEFIDGRASAAPNLV